MKKLIKFILVLIAVVLLVGLGNRTTQAGYCDIPNPPVTCPLNG